MLEFWAYVSMGILMNSQANAKQHYLDEYCLEVAMMSLCLQQGLMGHGTLLMSIIRLNWEISSCWQILTRSSPNLRANPPWRNPTTGLEWGVEMEPHNLKISQITTSSLQTRLSGYPGSALWQSQITCSDNLSQLEILAKSNYRQVIQRNLFFFEAIA